MFSRFFAKSKTEDPYAGSQYSQLGGDPGVEAMANRFYDIMESEPAVHALLALHPQPLDSVRGRFFDFLSGWLGGPQRFVEKYGHPRLRARHLPFKIDESMRDQWLYCMYQVIDEQVDDTLLKQQLRAQFTQLAHHMINS
ncbi:hemoglobin-like oxygen-binding protein [Aliidiomarina sedimenti]|uniref:Hemoglobin-like oxygen-binding protein n=1 Tax=Aliidiomarina sedimenti TaxID=1933879 RepID=A0ABY0C0D4_9GAMM|nr:group II truncated hemoglobin [Aliidiomarina sedimenti]RUO30871.1 hemoglobin-like oxygen-binding protein [Aliidiomarina sedimenti]